MNCKSCGTSLPDDAVACWKCGTPIGKSLSEMQLRSEQIDAKKLSTINQEYSPWKIGCLLYGLIAPLVMVGLYNTIQRPSRPASETAFGMLLILAVWLSGPVAGVILLSKKKYLGETAGAGCALLVLAGWWALPIGLVTGPLLWLVALFLPPRMTCPACKQIIAGDATRCPHCATEVSPIIQK
jgi:RNA polymerase subunit RPABC4/transcription elongation factor Spt4